MRRIVWIAWGDRAILRAAIAYELPIMFLWLGNRQFSWRFAP